MKSPGHEKKQIDKKKRRRQEKGRSGKHIQIKKMKIWKRGFKKKRKKERERGRLGKQIK